METNNKIEKNLIVLLGAVMLVTSFYCQFHIVGLDFFATRTEQIFSLYILPIGLFFLSYYVDKTFLRRITLVIFLIVYTAALIQLLTFFKTWENESVFLKNDILSNSSIKFSRDSEYGFVNQQIQIGNIVKSNIYLIDIYQKTLYQISSGDPILSSNGVLFSPNGDKILYGFQNTGLNIFDIGNSTSSQVTASIDGYDFLIATKYFSWYERYKHYQYGWINDNQIGFSCAKESEEMRAGHTVQQDIENNFLYCIYDINSGNIITTKNVPRFVDGNIGVDERIKIKLILPGFDGPTAEEVYYIDKNEDEKLLYRGNRFYDVAVFATFKGLLLIKRGNELIKIN